MIFDSCSYSRKLYAKTLLTFLHNTEKGVPFGFSVGDPVIINLLNQNKYVTEFRQRGMIYHVDTKFIKITINNLPSSEFFDSANTFFLTKNLDDIQYKRILHALSDLITRGETRRLSEISKKLIGIENEELPLNREKCRINGTLEPDFFASEFDRLVLSKEPEKAKNFHRKEFLNQDLDYSQRKAVDFALANDLSIIHGPPGTGKTSTLVEIIRQAQANNLRTLVCGASNGAIDSIISQLAPTQAEFVRLGRPARALKSSRCHTIDYWLNQTLGEACLMKMKELMKRICEPKYRQKLAKIFKILNEERDGKTRDIVERKSTIIGTLVSASPLGQLKMMLCKPDFWFDVVIVDECSQAMEPLMWIVIPLAKKLVLAGDYNQLPPVIYSRKAANLGLELTLLDRCVDIFKSNVVQLTVQYRMNETLMGWTNKYFYGNSLVADASVKNIHLKDLAKSLKNHPTLCFIDTKGCAMRETRFANSKSSCNIFEAILIEMYVQFLVKDRKLPSDKIGIITPYVLQRRLIERRVSEEFPDVEIKSVDGFQGREKDVIILSLVRSNTKQIVGFLSSRQRINVSVTRARRHLAIIGDSTTLVHDSALDDLINYIRLYGKRRAIRDHKKLVWMLHNSSNPELLESELDASVTVFNCAAGEGDEDEDEDADIATMEDNISIHGSLSDVSDPGIEPADVLEDHLL